MISQRLKRRKKRGPELGVGAKNVLLDKGVGRGEIKVGGKVWLTSIGVRQSEYSRMERVSS